MSAAKLDHEQAVFWKRFQDATGETGWPRSVDGFGDDPAMQDALLALLLAGTKRATATLARWFESRGEPLPRPGDLWLITDGKARPACVVRTRSVDICPVSQVDAAFAFEEGEGDRSLDYWLAEHRAYYRREAEREGFEYSDDLKVVCERFELVWPPEETPAGREA